MHAHNNLTKSCPLCGVKNVIGYNETSKKYSYLDHVSHCLKLNGLRKTLGDEILGYNLSDPDIVLRDNGKTFEYYKETLEPFGLKINTRPVPKLGRLPSQSMAEIYMYHVDSPDEKIMLTLANTQRESFNLWRHRTLCAEAFTVYINGTKTKYQFYEDKIIKLN